MSITQLHLHTSRHQIRRPSRFFVIVLISLIGLFTFLNQAYAETITESTSVANNLGLYGGQIESIAVNPATSSIFATTNSASGVFYSNDAGVTWNTLPITTNYGKGKDVAINGDDNLVFVLIGDSILLSADDGSTWTDISDNLGENASGQHMIYGDGRLMVSTNDGRVAISDDLGETFTTARIKRNWIITSLVSAGSADTYYAVMQNESGDTERLYRSTDGGSTWADMSITDAGVESGSRFSYVVVDPTNANHIVITTIVGGYPAYQTTDGGTSWTALSNDEGDVRGGCLMIDTTGRVYVGSNYSDNSTESTPTWSSINPETDLSSIFADHCAYDPNDTNVIYYNTTLGVAASSDRGATFTDNVSGMTAFQTYDISQPATNKDIVAIGANGGIALTTNFTSGDPDWEYPIDVHNGDSVYAVWIDPNNTDHMVVGTSSFYYTDDGGSTWSEATGSFNGTVWDIVPSRVTDGTLYAVWQNLDLDGDDFGGVMKSEDNGESWTDLGFKNDWPAAEISVASDDTLYVGTGGDLSPARVVVYDGSTWTVLGNIFGDVPLTSVVVDPADDNRLFVTSENNDSEGGLFLSEDAGTTWTQITDGLDGVYNLATLTVQSSTSETYYVTGQNGASLNGVIYKSVDNGVTWNLYYTGLKQEGFYALFYDGLLLGNDRGLYSIHSRAKMRKLLKTKTTDTTTIKISLRDAASNKRLSYQRIKVLRKKNGNWQHYKSKVTNQKGIVRIKAASSIKRIKLQWVPKNQKAEEYTTANKIFRLRKK